MEQVILFQEVTQMFTYVYLQHFRENGEHRNRSIVVLVISTPVTFKNRGNFCDLAGSRKSLCRQAVVQQLRQRWCNCWSSNSEYFGADAVISGGLMGWRCSSIMSLNTLYQASTTSLVSLNTKAQSQGASCSDETNCSLLRPFMSR